MAEVTLKVSYEAVFVYHSLTTMRGRGFPVYVTPIIPVSRFPVNPRYGASW